MAPGIPNKVYKAYRKLDKDREYSPYLAKIYYPYVKNYVKFKTWKNINRKQEASIHPLKLLLICPGKVSKRMKKGEEFRREDIFFPKIIDGKWDKKRAKNIEDDLFFTAALDHYNRDIPWEQTEWYESRSHKSKRRNKRIKEMDSLYEKIKKEGYKTQKQLSTREKEINTTTLHHNYLNEFNEITVNIGRDGQFIFEECRHRLAIAKALNLNQIPVRVLVRHQKWQQKRNFAVTKLKELEEKYKQHPDITYLID